MRLQIEVQRADALIGLSVSADPTATVGDAAAAIERLLAPGAQHAESTLRLLAHPPVELDPASLLQDTPLRSGHRVESAAVSAYARSTGLGPAAARLRVLEGPDAGRDFDLPSGSSIVGRDRDADVRLTDPLVSKRHLRINVAGGVEVTDQNSANGVEVGGRPVTRALLEPADVVRIGSTVLAVTRLRTGDTVGAVEGGVTVFTRSPRVVARFAPVGIAAPEPPDRPDEQPFPFIAMVAPLVMGVVLFLVTRQLISVLFVALSPLIALGTWVDHRIRSRRRLRRQRARFEEALEALRLDVQDLQRVERAVRQAEQPSVAECEEAALGQTPLLWTRRVEHDEFLQVRLGLGRLPSRCLIELPSLQAALPEYASRLVAVRSEHAEADDLPVIGDLRSTGSIGIAGGAAADVARGVVLQLATLHAPADLVLTALVSPRDRDDWDWLRWLPHAAPGAGVLPGTRLTAEASAAGVLLAALERLVESRPVERPAPRGADDGEQRPPVVPAVLVVVSDDAPVDRARLIRLAELGPDRGVHLLWCATELARIPAAARTFVVAEAGAGSVGIVRAGRHEYPVALEGVSRDAADRAARAITAVVDAGGHGGDEGALPPAVGFGALAGEALLHESQAVVDRWAESGAVAAGASPAGLRALVGVTAEGLLHLDLRRDGPHALVGGTTGAGKSEFLQTWVLGLASTYSPRQVTFLFVDYKGGSAFADCVRLPHTVGLVTDLSPHLVRRALTSLRAELRHREEVLLRHGAKDLISMERSGAPDTPPSLVIVVDEFAALVQEMPEFLDGVVDVAQRGRALGLHLILATQRPAGVIRDSLRTNTNLRVALRMADAEDSLDVLGDALAARFPPDIPGRAAVKAGPGLPTIFQAAYTGGRSAPGAVEAQVTVTGLGFEATRWPQPVASAPVDVDAPADLTRAVDVIVSASARTAVPAPRRPWLDELAPVYEFLKLGRSAGDVRIPLGVLDRPDRQEQVVAVYEPDRDGNLAVFGTGASGKSALLRTIAVAAGLTGSEAPVQVYAIDAGARGLAMLEGLPHVGAVVDLDDDERIMRLLRTLADTVDERAARYSAAGAGTVTEYRTLTGRRDEARILLLIDGIGAFREQHEFQPVFQLLQQIAIDGRQVGVHLVLAGERTNALPPSLGATVQRRVVLRMASEDEYLLLGVPRDVIGAQAPPGRGLLDGEEMQVAVLGGSPNLALQARAAAALAVQLRRRGASEAPGVAVLGTDVPLESLPTRIGAEEVAIGLGYDSLDPVGLVPRGLLVVTGPQGSGRSTAMRSIVTAATRGAGREVVHVGADPRESRMAERSWTATSADAATEIAERAADRIEAGRWPEPVVVIERIGDLAQSGAEPAVERLIRVAVKAGGLVIAEDEPQGFAGYSSLTTPFKAAKRGLVLAQGDLDADALMGLSSGRAPAGGLPPGRGYLASRGRMVRLQVARTAGGEVPIDAVSTRS